jgi:hypothetical protein
MASIAGAALIAGCAGSPPAKHAAAKPGDPPGTLRSHDGTVSMVLPSDWIAVSTNAPDYKQLAAKLGNANKQLKEFELLSAGALLVGISSTQARAKTAVVETVGVKSGPSNGQTAFTDFQLQQIRRDYAQKNHVDGDVSMEAVSVPAGAGLRYAARIKIKRPGTKPAVVQNIGYLIFHGGMSYTITFTSLPERAEAMAQIADKAVKSLQIK